MTIILTINVAGVLKPFFRTLFFPGEELDRDSVSPLKNWLNHFFTNQRDGVNPDQAYSPPSNREAHISPFSNVGEDNWK